MSDWFKDKIDCDMKCDVPIGKVMIRVPPPRHAWTDILRCPNCGECFLIKNEDEIKIPDTPE